MRIAHVLALLLAVGCSKDPEKASEKSAGEFFAKSARKDIDEMKAAIAAGKPGDAKFNCAHMANYDMLEKADQAVAAELKQLCTKDLYLAMIKVEVEKAEAARKAKPDPNELVSECYNASYDYARKEMIEAKTIDLARELVARFDAVCPGQK